MSASAFETMLARVHAALLAGMSGVQVERGRQDAFGADEVPAVNLLRGETNDQPFGAATLDQQAAFSLEFWARGAAWETSLDALHMDAHRLLLADAPLAVLCRGLRCLGTESAGDSADEYLGHLTARYQAHIAVRQGDLTRAIT